MRWTRRKPGAGLGALAPHEGPDETPDARLRQRPAAATEEPAASTGPAPARSAAPASALAWDELYDQFFSVDPDAAAGAAAVFSRMIRFWLVRVGFRDELCASDDVVQDVLLELARFRDDIENPLALGGWLRTTTVRKAQDRWRGIQRQPVGSSEPLRSVPAAALLPDEQVMQKQDRSDLLDAIEQLPPLLRRCVELQLRGLSESEIAAHLEADPACGAGPVVHRHSVKNWLRKARLTLREALLERQA